MTWTLASDLRPNDAVWFGEDGYRVIDHIKVEKIVGEDANSGPVDTVHVVHWMDGRTTWEFDEDGPVFDVVPL